MNEFEITSQKMTKLEGGEKPETEHCHPDDQLEIIVKVSEANYVPGCLTPRSRIDDMMFTAEVQRRSLDALEMDTKVVSISISKTLKLFKTDPE